MKRLRNAVGGVLLGTTALAGIGSSLALAGTGQPSSWQLNFQTPVTEMAERISALHDAVNLVIIVIAIFVLILLIIVVARFNEGSNPTPSKTTHNTMLEVVWTIVPVLILVGIALPSFKLLFAQYTYTKPDVTIKATGNQWNWTYQYPDAGGFTFTAIMLNDAERDALIKKGIPAPRLLSVDNEVVVPVNQVVHVLITASDVIHNWTVPSFGSKQDAVPGRVTSTWFKARQEGVFYGQCSELCGKDHAFMPIAVRVVKPEIYQQWADAMKNRQRKRAKEIIEKAALEQAGSTRLADDGIRAPAVAAAVGK